MSLTRRQLVTLGFGGIAAYAILGDSSTPTGAGGTIAFEDGSGARFETTRPAAGGTAINIEASDGVGTLAGGVDGPDGEKWAITCRHVVDPDYPDSDEDDVIGTEVYQPYHDEEDDPIGEVAEIGPSKGRNSTDWAAIEITDSTVWTPHVLGLGEPTDKDAVEVGERLVASGIRTGLIGGEVVEIDVSRNWRGTIIDGMIGYRVDENLPTAGNSGTFVSTLDETGTLELVGIHAFNIDEIRYAVPVDHLPDIGFDTPGETPTAPDAGSFVEGAVTDWDDTRAVVAVANIGGDTVENRPIEIQDNNGEFVDSIDVTLDPFDSDILELQTPEDDTPVLDTGDVVRATIDP